mgnify:CR=1 FL=1
MLRPHLIIRMFKTYTQLLEKYFYNADSIYSQGIEVNRLLEKSRGLLAKMLDVDEEEMIFTSCGSEANNMAIKGIAFQYQNRGETYYHNFDRTFFSV